MDRLEIVYESLGAIKPHDANPKDHDLEEIKASLRRFGFVQPLVRNEATGVLSAGHGRTEALEEMKAAGEQPPGRILQGTDDGEWLVPVVAGVSFESEAEAEAYLVADNAIGERGGWVDQKLHDLLKRQATLEGTGYEPTDVRALFDRLKTRGRKNPRGVDDLPDTFAEPVTKPDDLWTVAGQRILCGDSDNAEDVDRLLAWKPAPTLKGERGEPVQMVLTDPPFAIYGSATGLGSDVADDLMVRPFFEAMLRTTHRVLPWFGHAYVHCDWRSWASLWEGARRAKMTPKNCLVWDKGTGGLGSNYANSHEFIGFFTKMPPETTTRSSGRTGQRTVMRRNLLQANRVAGADRLHNAAKPVAILEELVNNSSDKGGRVLDLYLGSGSTLVACARIDRRGLGMEISPEVCDIAVRRLEEQTGQVPTLERDGETSTFSFADAATKAGGDKATELAGEET